MQRGFSHRRGGEAPQAVRGCPGATQGGGSARLAALADATARRGGCRRGCATWGTVENGGRRMIGDPDGGGRCVTRRATAPADPARESDACWT